MLAFKIFCVAFFLHRQNTSSHTAIKLEISGEKSERRGGKNVMTEQGVVMIFCEYTYTFNKYFFLWTKLMNVLTGKLSCDSYGCV